MEENPELKNLNKKHKRDQNKNPKTEKSKNKNQKPEKSKEKTKEEEKEEITEGKATISLVNHDKTFSAFYNPAQELNRDLTVISIATYFTFSKYLKPKDQKNLSSKKFSIIEPLSATGLRGMRYYTELPKEKISLITINDMDKKAVECIKINIEKNKVNEEILKVHQEEATSLMYKNLKLYDIIDLDPYGSAIPFIDSCIQCGKNGSLLCLTFTDMPVLCGNYPETTLYKYGSIPYKVPFCHEMAKRIALYSISNNASKYKKVIKPLLSYNAEFYIRLFFIIKESPDDCKKNPFKYGYMWHCRQCQNRIIKPMAEYKENKKANSVVKFSNLTIDNVKCNCCNSFMCMCGPFWISDLHDEDWIKDLLGNLNKSEWSYLKYNSRIENILKGILNELVLKDMIFNYDYSQFSRDVNLSVFKMGIFEGAINSLGYKMVQSYYDPNLFKTDAPPEVIYDIMKSYKKENYKEEEYLKNVNKDSYKYNILMKDIKVKPKFVEVNREKNIKYPMNPFPNWGPKGKPKEKKDK